jgi:uncharacterized membrane-anchored protein YhcB (DUF1043 family)
MNLTILINFYQYNNFDRNINKKFASKFDILKKTNRQVKQMYCLHVPSCRRHLLLSRTATTIVASSSHQAAAASSARRAATIISPR